MGFFSILNLAACQIDQRLTQSFAFPFMTTMVDVLRKRIKKTVGDFSWRLGFPRAGGAGEAPIQAIPRFM